MNTHMENISLNHYQHFAFFFPVSSILLFKLLSILKQISDHVISPANIFVCISNSYGISLSYFKKLIIISQYYSILSYTQSFSIF